MLLLAAAPANSAGCEPSTTQADATVDLSAVDGSTYYYAEDCGILNHPCLVLFSVWVYEESNGIPGLQRDDQVHDDTCGGAIESDTVVL